MKKIFTFIAALCCTMFFSIARATALTDGALIFVGPYEMTHEDVTGWTPVGVSDAITYDETNHVLTLNELDFTETLDIDASAFGDAEFTIRIEGTAMTTFDMQAQNAIRFRGGKGLIIEGEKGTGLSININNVSGNGGCGIMCATTFSTSMSASDYLPLTIQGGVAVGVNNYGANENKYAAVIAYPINIKSSDLSAATTDGTGIPAVQTATGISGVSTVHSQWMNYDEYDDYFWEWKAYSVAYDVWVNGYALTDRRSSLSSSDMTCISKGSINYDPENNVLELKGGFTLDVHDGWSDGISYSGVEPLTIRLSAVGSTSISETSMSSSKAALHAKGPVIIDLAGCDLELTSTNGTGLWIQNEVTIKNSWGNWEPYQAEKKTLTVNSPVGFGIIGDASNAKMAIDHANVIAGGNKGSVIEIPTTLTGVTLESGYHWNTMNSVVDEYDAEAADPMNPIHFNLSEWKLITDVWPEGAGKILIEVDGTTYEDEYAFTENKSASLIPVPNDGWEFYNWEDGNKVTPRNINLLVSDGSRIRGANFVHLIESETQWYTLVNVGSKHSIYPLNDKLRTLGDKIADLTPSDERTIVCAAFANEHLYYIETNSLGTQSWLVKAPFDGTTLGSPEVITDDAVAAEYSFYYNIAYSNHDECFYGACRRMADAKDIFIRLNLDGTVTPLIDLSGYIFDALTVDDNGLVYIFFNDNDLYVYNPETAASTHIGEVALMLPGASSTAMFYDESTDEMFIYDDDFFWRIDKTNGDVVLVWMNSTLATNCIFSIEAPGTKYTITVQSEDESKGTVSPSGTKKYKENTTLVLTPTPKKGYMFVEWQEDHNTDNPRTVTVTEDKTYTAVFADDPNFTLYDVFIGEEQFYTGRLTMTKEDNSAIKNDGSVTFDPTTNTLILNEVQIESTLGGIQIGVVDNGFDATVIVNGTCAVKSNPMYCGFLLYGTEHSVLKGGSDNPNLTIEDFTGIHDADFEISDLTAVLKGGNFSIQGTQTNKLIVTGANLTAKAAATATICNWAAVEYKYCSVTPADILDSEGKIRIYNDDVCDDTNNRWTSDIVFAPLPKLSVKPVQEGTAHFKLKAGEETFTDEGYFAAGTKVTITCEPASDFVFGRWTDDLDWTDKTKKIGAKREFDMPAVNTDLEALFYFNVESDADWFGINGDEFVKFSFNDHAEKAARATNTLTNIKAGDWFDDTWVFVEGTDVKQIPFSGTLEDGKDIKGDIKEFNKESLSGVTDMAYDLASEELYAVAGSKLYKITTKENKEVATFKLDEVETPVVAIAFDVDGNLFALGVGDGTEGVLYTASVSKDVATLKIVGKKDNGGKIGIKVNNAPQSLVFDAQTGELFWGAPDYLRIINTDKMKTFIVGDLGQKAGMQGYIQSLHRMIELVEVTVKVAEDQESWGIVYLNDDKSTVKNPLVSASFVEGTTVTIKAEANPGYHFDYWVYLDGKKEKSFKGDDKETYEFGASNITYVAYFAEDEEGIESIQTSEVSSQKILLDGVLYIIKNGETYNAQGLRIE